MLARNLTYCGKHIVVAGVEAVSLINYGTDAAKRIVGQFTDEALHCDYVSPVSNQGFAVEEVQLAFDSQRIGSDNRVAQRRSRQCAVLVFIVTPLNETGRL